VLDLNKSEEIQIEFRQHLYRAAIHCGAVTDIDNAEAYPGRTLNINATSTAVLADECHRAGIPMVFISTDYVFGGKNEEISEWEEHKPLNIYGLSKSHAESAVKHFLPGKNYILRTASPYGITRKGYVPHVVHSVLSGAVVKDTFWAPTHRTFQPTSAKRLAERIIECVFQDTIPPGTYHATGTGAATHLDVARAVIRTMIRLNACDDIMVRRDPTWVDKTRRPSSSLLSHACWASTDVKPMGPWEYDLDKDLPEIIENVIKEMD
jgi:dTDP-4-dehydrorhamnose reductase